MIRKSLIIICAVIFFLGGCQSEPQSADASSALEVASVQPSLEKAAQVSTPSRSVPKTGVAAKQSASGSVLGGAWGGSMTSAFLDRGDVSEMSRAEARAYTAAVGQKVTWSNAKTGHSGTITPARDFYAPNGAYCRDFMQTLMIEGRSQQAQSRACQQPNGSWKLTQ